MKVLLPALAVALLVGGSPDDDFRSERQILRHLTVRLAQFRTELKDTSELSGSVSRLKSLLEQMTTQAADLKHQDGRVHNFEVTDLDPKSRVEERLLRDYGDRLKILVQNQKAFHAAHGPPSPNNVEELARCDAMVTKIKEVEAEGKQKVQLAIQASDAAQKEHAALQSRQRELQAILDRTTEEFRTLRGTAVTQMHSLESAVLDLRRTAGAGQHNFGRDEFDGIDRAGAVNLPDVVTPEGKPLPLALPPAVVQHPHAPPGLVGNSKVQRLQEEGEALQLKAHELEIKKAKLFSDKNATSEEWTAYGREVREIGVKMGQLSMIKNGVSGSKLLDMTTEMDATPQTEPPPPTKETKP